MPVQWMVGTNGDDKQVSIKIRALVVDARMREYVLGSPHEVTERLFVVRRVFRVNPCRCGTEVARATRRLADGRQADGTHLGGKPAGV